MTQTASYNNLNQLTNLSGQALSFDANGNLLSDGQRNYTWDAENRLLGITYPGQSGKQTAFVYDGLSRRTAITSTPAGASAVKTSYIWCGSNICQARNATNSPTRGYYAEGESVPATPAQSYYYGPDQIGSVRRVFASAGSAPAYGYDPYGNALQATAPLTDFGYAGMLNNVESGLYLTQYRAYDPVVGRWLSRDPIGENSDPASNLYAYADSAPTMMVDPDGRQAGPYAPPPPSIPGGPWKWSRDPGNDRGGKYIGPNNNEASWDPEGHWDCNDGTGGPRQRYDFRGNPLTKQQAHDPPWFTPRIPPWPRSPVLPIPMPPICTAMPEACGIDPNGT